MQIVRTNKDHNPKQKDKLDTIIADYYAQMHHEASNNKKNNKFRNNDNKPKQEVKELEIIQEEMITFSFKKSFVQSVIE